MRTRVVHLQHHYYDVYIGRAGKGKDGYFGNPFAMRSGSHAERSRVLTAFENYFINRMYEDPEYNRRILELKGKVLGCFCKPLACHGDIIASWIDAKENSD